MSSVSLPTPSRPGAWLVRAAPWLALAAWLAGVLVLAAPLIHSRHLQVDEFQNIYDATLITSGGDPSLPFNVKPWSVLLGWLTGLADTTMGKLHAARWAFGLLFLANILLVALVQPSLTTWQGRGVVLIAATLTWVLWRYGFEVRHDVLLLTGLLVLYGLTQRLLKTGRDERWVFVAGGLVAAVMVSNTLKGSAYAALGLFLLLLAAGGGGVQGLIRRRLRPGLLIGAGAVFGVGIGLLLLLATGMGDRYVEWMGDFTSRAGTPKKFTATKRMLMFSATYPVPVALALPCLGYAVRDLLRWPLRLSPTLVTAGYLVGTFCVMKVNPTPFPYNDLLFVPFVLLAAVDTAGRLRLPDRRTQALLAATLLATMAIAWVRARLLDDYGTRSNRTQRSYIAAAEALTAPDDPILDGVGMIPSRPPPGKDWILHSSLRGQYSRGERTRFSAFMRDVAPPVLVSGYRWSWLKATDEREVNARYHRLVKGFRVLGGKLSTAAGKVQIHRKGRYVFTGHRGWDGLTVAGQPVQPGAVLGLDRGLHDYSGAPPRQVVYHWVGPRLSKAPSIIPETPAKRLFVRYKTKKKKRKRRWR